MKSIHAIAIAVLLSGNAFSQHPPLNTDVGVVVTDNDTVKQKTRRFWVKAKGYLSEDKATFTEDAQQTLADLGKEIDKVADKVTVTAPPCFLTRLLSLRQQHQHLSFKLQELTAEAIKTRLSGPRYAFDKCVASLEAAIEQADDEADVLARIGSTEKLEAKKRFPWSRSAPEGRSGSHA